MKRRDFLVASVMGCQRFRTSLAQHKSPLNAARRLKIDHALADPFCLRWGEIYYLTGTYSSGRPGQTGRAFDLLRSKDLEEWKSLGPVLRIPDYEGSHQANYWAPEILPLGNQFFLYYTSDSFGDPYRRFVRVAVADSIEGPYQGDGQPLTVQPSIDGHPVYPSGNEGYLFYTANEGNSHMGQLLVDRMMTPTRLAGTPQRVFPSETVEWEEGSFILRRNQEYFLFSSQGNWRDDSYHVLVARSKSILGPYVRISHRENRAVLQTTRKQVGPGHNSLFKGPGGRTYLCYHAWDQQHTGRYAWVAPLEWDDDFPFVADDAGL